MMIGSLANMCALIDFANLTDDTQELVDLWQRKPEEGGMYMTGPLIAQEMICVMSMTTKLISKTYVYPGAPKHVSG